MVSDPPDTPDTAPGGARASLNKRGCNSRQGTTAADVTNLELSVQSDSSAGMCYNVLPNTRAANAVVFSHHTFGAILEWLSHTNRPPCIGHKPPLSQTTGPREPSTASHASCC